MGGPVTPWRLSPMKCEWAALGPMRLYPQVKWTREGGVKVTRDVTISISL